MSARLVNFAQFLCLKCSYKVNSLFSCPWKMTCNVTIDIKFVATNVDESKLSKKVLSGSSKQRMNASQYSPLMK